MAAFLKKAYGRAREADKFLLSQQQPVTSDGGIYGLRGMVCAATEYQNRIIFNAPSLSDSSVVAQFSHPDPNHAPRKPHMAARLVANFRTRLGNPIVSVSGAKQKSYSRCPT